MSAGLPGLGLGGIFFLLSALLAPVVELVRTARGESSIAAWIEVGRQFALALAMIVAINATLQAIYLLAPLVGFESVQAPGSLMVLPLLPIAITIALLGLLLLAAKAAALASRARQHGLPSLPGSVALPSRGHVLAGATALTVAWFALLAVGASQLQPISTDRGQDDRQAAPDQERRDSIAASTEIAALGPATVPASVHPPEDVPAPTPANPPAPPPAGQPSSPDGSGALTPAGADSDTSPATPPSETPDPTPAPTSPAPAPAPQPPSPTAPAPTEQPGSAATPPVTPGTPGTPGPPPGSSAQAGTGPPDHAGPSA